MTWTVETALAAAGDGSHIVVAGEQTATGLPIGSPLHLMIRPREVTTEEQEAIDWLHANPEASTRFVQNLGEKAKTDPRVIYDDERNWRYALKLLRRAEWPRQSNANSTETVLMSYAWWWACMEAKGPRLAEHYANMISRLTVPGAADATGQRNIDEHVRLKALAQIGSGARILDAAFEMDAGLRSWSHHWCSSGFARVEVGEKTVAAMIESDAPPDVMAPWKAFSIIVPPGLCDPVRRLWCGSSSSDPVVKLYGAVDSNGSGAPTDPQDPNAATWSTPYRHEMLQNLVRGVYVAIENHSAKKSAKCNKSSPGNLDDHLPNFEHWIVSAPIEIDLRGSVIEQWSGKRSAHRVKSHWTVRGHYRNQACGKEFSERKRQWIHPYRKGDMAAAGLLRRLKIKDPPQQEMEPTQ